jgi:hypothetical protein
MPYGNSIYSRILAKDPVIANVTHDEVAYKVTLSWSKSIPTSDAEIY